MISLDPPQLKKFIDARVLVGAPYEVGMTPRGNRRIIPITGGEVTGQGWTGKILPGGADFQIVVSDTMASLDARYLIETDGGDLIFLINRAIRVSSAETTKKLVLGEPVDPKLVYFRCVPSFESSAPSFSWINERLFVGSGIRRPSDVQISCFSLD